MNNLVISIATDFSVEFGELHGLREPADEYYDPVIEIFGESPSENDARRVLENRTGELAGELSDWLEIEISEATARDVLRRALINYFGASFNE